MTAYETAIELAEAIDTIETAVSTAIEDGNGPAERILAPILARALDQWADLVVMHPDVSPVRDFVR